MKLPREYRKFIGRYSACTNAYGRKMLRKFGYGPETEVVKEVVEEVKTESKPKAKKKRTKKVK
jgi:hypothetical protein